MVADHRGLFHKCYLPASGESGTEHANHDQAAAEYYDGHICHLRHSAVIKRRKYEYPNDDVHNDDADIGKYIVIAHYS